jgi:hypothetical protein
MPAATEAYYEAPSAVREAGIALVALLVAALVGYGWQLGFFLENAHNGLIGGSFTAVGQYVVRMRPRHREGWLFVATGVLHAVMFFGRQYGLEAARCRRPRGSAGSACGRCRWRSRCRGGR